MHYNTIQLHFIQYNTTYVEFYSYSLMSCTGYNAPSAPTTLLFWNTTQRLRCANSTGTYSVVLVNKLVHYTVLSWDALAV